MELYLAETPEGSQYFTPDWESVAQFLKTHPTYVLKSPTLRCTPEAWRAMCEMYRYDLTVH